MKTNQLYKEFNSKFAEAEAKHQRSLVETRKEAETREQKMIAEHNEEMEEMQTEIYNFDNNMEDVKEDYENRCVRAHVLFHRMDGLSFSNCHSIFGAFMRSI